MFKISGNTISITRGDTAFFTLNITQNGEPYDYSDDTVLFTVKSNVYTSDVLLQKQVQYGENVVILPSDTNKLNYGEYWYDVQLTTSLGVVDTVITPSRFRVMQEVTFNGN